MKYKILLFLACLPFSSANTQVITGAEQTKNYFSLLKNKRIGLFTNHTGIISNEHLADVLHRKGFNLKFIFAPEHGFRGNADAGEKIQDEIDKKTGIPIVGKNNLG